MQVRSLSKILSLGLFLAALPPPARAAEDVRFGPYDVRSAFYVAKSESPNQVHYAVRVDAECRPRTDKPVFGYWRRVHRGERYDEPLEGPGRHVYGASDSQEVTPGRTGGWVRMYVKAAKRVKIELRIAKGKQGCEATAFTTIAGEPARLEYAFLQLTRLKLGVRYVELVGVTSAGRRVTERIR